MPLLGREPASAKTPLYSTRLDCCRDCYNNSSTIERVRDAPTNELTAQPTDTRVHLGVEISTMPPDRPRVHDRQVLRLPHGGHEPLPPSLHGWGYHDQPIDAARLRLRLPLLPAVFLFVVDLPVFGKACGDGAEIRTISLFLD